MKGWLSAHPILCPGCRNFHSQEEMSMRWKLANECVCPDVLYAGYGRARWCVLEEGHDGDHKTCHKLGDAIFRGLMGRRGSCNFERWNSRDKYAKIPIRWTVE